MPFEKKKKYGQNFLTSAVIPRRIVSESLIDGDCGALEIGPGFGILTRELAATAKKVVAVEIDAELIPILKEKLAEYDNTVLYNCDIMKIDLNELIEREFAGMPVAVCANLPYYITTPIIMRLLESNCGFRSVTVMVQKEVAQRLTAKCGSAEYGAITAAVNFYSSVKKLFNVSAGSFSPPPKVDSAVIRFDIFEKCPYSLLEGASVPDVIKAAFSQRRKTLTNALGAYYADKFNKDEIIEIIEKAGFEQNIRGECLDIYDFCSIANEISKRLEN